MFDSMIGIGITLPNSYYPVRPITSLTQDDGDTIKYGAQSQQVYSVLNLGGATLDSQNINIHCAAADHSLTDWTNVVQTAQVDAPSSTATRVSATPSTTRLTPTTATVDEAGSGMDLTGNFGSGDGTATNATTYRRRADEYGAPTGVSRIVQWDAAFRQPDFGDSDTTGFTGPAFADCTDPNLPAEHCCRVRVSFWVSDDPDNQYYFENPAVTGCLNVCGDHQRTGSNVQCVPAQPECNDWDGAGSVQFLGSEPSLILMEAYCLCGMKTSVVSGARNERRASEAVDAWRWPAAHVASIDVVSGGHFAADDTCYATSVNYHTTVLESMDTSTVQTCPSASGANMTYSEMAATDVAFDANASSSLPYAACGAAGALDCCAVERFDAMGTHYYSMTAPRNALSESIGSAFGDGHPFGVAASASTMVYAFDFNNDGVDDVVVGNRIYLSRAQPADGTSSFHAWGEYRHPGREFTSATPVAMVAVQTELYDVVPATLDAFFNVKEGIVFVAIAYADNVVIMYTVAATLASTDHLVLRHNRTLDDGSHGAVSALGSFTRSVDAEIERTRVAFYVAYTDAEDVVHAIDFPTRHVDSSINGYVERVHTYFPLRAADGRRPTPSLGVASTLWETTYEPVVYPRIEALVASPPPPASTTHLLDVVFVATPNGFANRFVTDTTGFGERSIGTDTTENSVAVDAVTSRYNNDAGNSVVAIIVCFANDNQKNSCYRIYEAEESRANERFDNFRATVTQRYPFGEADEPTSDIALTDLNHNGHVDVVTLERSGYVRVYRGGAYTSGTGDFGNVVPETVGSAYARAHTETTGVGRSLNSLLMSGTTGNERFMSQSKLAIGKCNFCFNAIHPTQVCTTAFQFTCPETHPHCVNELCQRVDPIVTNEQCIADYNTPGVTVASCTATHPFCVGGFCSAERATVTNSGLTRVATTQREMRPDLFMIVHHHSPETNGGSCSMRCHEAGRMG
jgi:hypothetical protein